MEKFYNIEEQRYWNKEESFTQDGNEWSERFGSTDSLYNQLLRDKVNLYCQGDGLEIAPGWGRITEYLLPVSKSLSILDLNEVPVSKCVAKFGNRIKAYYVGDGKSLSAINNISLDFVFSFDSFVHIHWNVFEEYIKEFSRVLKLDGYGVIHHAWFGGGEDYSFKNLGGRANLDLELLNKTLNDYGFEVISQDTCNVSVWFDSLTDMITVFKKVR